MDFSNINTDSFFASINGKCNIDINFYNFVNSDRYKEPTGDFQEYYHLKDTFSCSKDEYFDYDKAAYIYPEVATMSYSKFEHKAINNIEVAWRSNVLEVAFLETEVSDENESIDGWNTKNPGLTIIDGKSIILDITTLIPNEDLENYMDNVVYMFFDKELKGKYILEIEDNVDDPINSSYLEWVTNSYVYTWLTPTEEPVNKLTVGLYE